ncbi:MAG: tetratricopeptide repeat protein [Bryobacteraceae bacterium]
MSPIGTAGADWGFLDRTVQMIAYKISYAIAGYDSWPYLWLRSASYGGLVLMIHLWGLRLLPGAPKSRVAAPAASIFLLVAPGPTAALVWVGDVAPISVLVSLVMTLAIWRQIEKTPLEWERLSPWRSPEQRGWLLKWIGLAFLVYLGYKTRGDLKLMPLILAGYVLLVRRKQWKLFAVPVGLMLLLAVPWSWENLTRLPPFLPGSGGSSTNWMWQPASFERFREFEWSSNPYEFASSLKRTPLSLAGLLAPFLLSAILAFLFWKTDRFGKAPWTTSQTPQDRARTFVLVWFGAILIGVSALPGINHFFRVRYSILTLTPVCILLAWIFGLFSESVGRLPKWAVVGCIALFTIQTGINLNRSVHYRRDLGQIMVGVDQVYHYVSTAFPNDQLALLPDFLPYDYHPEARPAIRNRDSLGSPEDLTRRHTPNHTSVISWEPSLWEQLDLVQQFSGCRAGTLFDAMVPCAPGTGAFLMRYIGPDPLYQAAEAARGKGESRIARALYAAFLDRHPNNLGARFMAGFVAIQEKDWAKSEQDCAMLERCVPNHPRVLYNRALAMIELKQYGPAIDRLKRVVQVIPQDYGALFNLSRAYRAAGYEQQARETLQVMKQLFPADETLDRLLAEPH